MNIDYHDFEGAAHVKDSAVDQWVDDLLAQMKANPKEKVRSLAAGDRMVVLIRHDDGCIEVNVCKTLKVGNVRGF